MKRLSGPLLGGELNVLVIGKALEIVELKLASDSGSDSMVLGAGMSIIVPGTLLLNFAV